jgi:archaeosine-15-forming tRNA-guanine transglycosylase
MKVVRVDWIKEVDRLLHPNEEVLVYTSDKRLIGVGKTQVSGQTILSSKRGTAVKIRDLRKEY